MDEQALLRAVLADPNDDTVRLAYADWLDENGRGDRAAFIRVQIELARFAKDDPRRPELIATEAELFGVLYPEQLRRELPGALVHYAVRYIGHYRRGFLAWIYLTARPVDFAAFCTLAPALFAHAPVDELCLGPGMELDWNGGQMHGALVNTERIHELAPLPELARLSVLRISSPVLDIDAVSHAVLANPHFRQLRRLHFENRYPTDGTMNGWNDPAGAFLVDHIAPATQTALRTAFGDRVSWDE